MKPQRLHSSPALFSKPTLLLFAMVGIIAIIMAFFFFVPFLRAAPPTVLLTDGFGTGDTENDIPGWDEDGMDWLNWTVALSPSSGNDSASPDGGRFAKIAEDEWICRQVDASGVSNAPIILSYYWRGDGDAEFTDSGIVEYRVASSCTAVSGWHTVDSYHLNSSDWSSLISATLPEEVQGRIFSLRFRTDSNHSDEYFRIDGISVIADVQSGELIVLKEVVNDNGGTKGSGDFSLYVDGNPVTSGAVNEFAPGVHVVSENTDTGYTASFGGDCDESGNVTVVDGEVVTCTITNDDLPGTVIVRKEVVNDSGGQFEAGDFNLYLDGNAVENGAETSVSTGAHVVTESAVPGYEGTFSGDCDALGNINVGNGETKTCILTNDDVPGSLTVIKHVINDNRGESLAGDFTMSVSGTDVSVPSFSGSETGVTVTLDAGSYGIDESANSSYYKTLGENCSGTIANGEDITCTVENNDIPLVTVCHIPENPDLAETIFVLDEEVQSHLDHGDYIGSCEGRPSDADLDGIPDETDNCRVMPNPDQADMDGDGLGDACDPDNDNDEVNDDIDNCPFAPNPQQEDNDSDGLGDVCDGDDDNDEIPDESDNCQFAYNPGQEDTDEDDLGDACDEDNGGALVIKKYICPAETALSRETNGPNSAGEFIVPEGCSALAGAYFGFIYEPEKEDGSGPYPGIDDETPFQMFEGATDASGMLTVLDLDSSGRYDIAEIDSSGNPLTDEEILGLFCSGDFGTWTDNYDFTFVPDLATTHCVSYNTLPSDSDQDGVLDGADNCPLISNPEQENHDDDALGDVCDDDDDNDEVPDGSDNCPIVSNPDQADNDSDGIGNTCDSTPNGEPGPSGDEGGGSGGSSRGVRRELSSGGSLASDEEGGLSSDVGGEPEAPLTRAYMAKMMMEVLGEDMDEVQVIKPPYRDVLLTHKYVKEVARAKELGVMIGYQHGRFFLPNHKVSRAEAVITLFRAFGIKYMPPSPLPKCTDLIRGAWYMLPMRKAIYVNLLGVTDGLCRPETHLTRGEFDTLLQKAQEL